MRYLYNNNNICISQSPHCAPEIYLRIFFEWVAFPVLDFGLQRPTQNGAPQNGPPGGPFLGPSKRGPIHGPRRVPEIGPRWVAKSGAPISAPPGRSIWRPEFVTRNPGGDCHQLPEGHTIFPKMVRKIVKIGAKKTKMDQKKFRIDTGQIQEMLIFPLEFNDFRPRACPSCSAVLAQKCQKACEKNQKWWPISRRNVDGSVGSGQPDPAEAIAEAALPRWWRRGPRVDCGGPCALQAGPPRSFVPPVACFAGVATYGQPLAFKVNAVARVIFFRKRFPTHRPDF